MDFMHDTLADGRAVRILTVLDVYVRECVALVAAQTFSGGDYYNKTRTHLSLAKDARQPRSVQRPSQGRVVEVPRVGGLHHECVRRAA
jgi:hypothetical protein